MKKTTEVHKNLMKIVVLAKDVSPLVSKFKQQL